MIQAAALGGTRAIVFLITLPASAIAIAVVRRGNLDMPLMAYGPPALILSAVLSFGAGARTVQPRQAASRSGGRRPGRYAAF